MTQLNAGHVPRPVTSNIAPNGNNEPALKDVLVELWQNVEKLLRQELALASAELDMKAQRLKREAASFGAGAAMMLIGALALVAALILLLSRVMPAWGAALATGAALMAGGFALVQKRPAIGELTPDRTLQSIKKDVQIFTEAGK